MKVLSEAAQAAKLIKVELKKAFPKIKFSVRSEYYSMGCSVNVSWIDGPEKIEVNKIVGKYQRGHFDGMTDSYDYSNRRNDIPQVMFVMTNRG